MWKGAEPEVEVFLFRHPESEANVANANFGNQAKLSPKGKRQVRSVFKRIQKLGIHSLLCSKAERTMRPVFETAAEHGLPAMAHQCFNEFRRPAWTIGKQNDDPDVERSLKRRINEFGPKYVPEDGEEDFVETYMILTECLDIFRNTAQRVRVELEDPRVVPRIGCITHGLRIRQLDSFIQGRESIDLLPILFKNNYDVTGFPNGAMQHIWYGYPFRETQTKCWNLERGDNSHIPPSLR